MRGEHEETSLQDAPATHLSVLQPGLQAEDKWRLFLQLLGAAGLVLLLATGELVIQNIVGFCIAASNAFGLIAGEPL